MTKLDDLKRRIESLEPGKRGALLERLRSTGAGVALTWADGLDDLTGLPDLAREAFLEPSITPSGRAHCDRAPERILLTGATGFIGAFLVCELLERTRAQIVCHVRCTSVNHGKQRVLDNLRLYGLNDSVNIDRVSIVDGDLATARLGLSESRFAALADEVDVIFHNGALVNFSYGFKPFIAPNVVGTQEVLRLACTSRPKRVNFVSTVQFFVFGGHASCPPTVNETTPLELASDSWGGYAQSKWVAERMVWIAAERGLPVSVFRPALVVGCSKTGACSLEELVTRTMEGAARLGMHAQYPVRTAVETVCVDFAARAIVALGLRASALGRAFHLFGPEPSEVGALVVDPLRSRGFALEPVSYPEWMELLRRTVLHDRENRLQALVPFLTTVWPGTGWTFHESLWNGPRLDSSRTLAELATLSIHCPSPVESAAQTVDWLMARGRLPPVTLLGSLR